MFSLFIVCAACEIFVYIGARGTKKHQGNLTLFCEFGTIVMRGNPDKIIGVETWQTVLLLMKAALCCGLCTTIMGQHMFAHLPNQ